MCRFKALFTFFFISLTLFQYILCVGSSLCQSSLVESLFLFQYILCVGSRICLYRLKKLFQRFNTSYVSVQENKQPQLHFDYEFQYILCVGSRAVSKTVNIAIKLFQYILCVGSSWNEPRTAERINRVSIHPMCRFKCLYPKRTEIFGFVSIHPMCRFKNLFTRRL